MAMHLNKKLAQVLSGGGGGGSSGVGTGNNANAGGSSAGAAGSPLPDNGNCSNAAALVSATPVTNELFNIAKAKKIELPSLSSRLVATAPSLDTHILHSTAPTDAKHLQSASTPSLSSLQSSTTAAPATAATTSMETQSTVIISFKSSQTPVHSPASLGGVFAPQPPSEEDTSLASALTLLNNNGENAAMCLSNNLVGATSLHPCTPRNNVLKKVASFTAEKASPGCSAKINNGDGTPGMVGALEGNGLRRSSFVPEKLSFAAYEKFEGQMLVKWFISSLQNNCSHVSEQDINVLTLQYCNNLINVGVLKQISERRDDVDIFSPFHMYQWTHTEAPTTSQPHTPGKLDKVNVWPYSSTPAGAIQRTHKRCIELTDLINASEATIYQYDRSSPHESSGYEAGVQEVGVQTEESSQATQGFVCCKCKSGTEAKENVQTCEKEVQVSLDVDDEKRDRIESGINPAVPCLSPISGLAPPPPPPPPPLPSADNFAPPMPPPPPPISSLPPPPPPPMGSGPPPPPPPAPPRDANTALPPLNLNSSGVPPPPPPGGLKLSTPSTPAPLPNPTEGGWFQQTSTLRKTAINPPKPMKPLYWTRIVTQPPPPVPPKPLPTAPLDDTDSSATSSPDDAPASKPKTVKEIWQEIDETDLDNMAEFTELFSREAVVPITKPKVKTKVRVKCTKVLDSKRSQNVGIIFRSSHVDFCEIEHAIYHVDTSVVSLETLQQIMNIKATNEELELIKEAAQDDVPLDYPEQFLLKISQISMSTERISCIVFMSEFEEAATVIERKLEVVLQLSQFLVESEELKLVFAIILTLGNYMNGGNRQRGQADGFTLEILSKLKDVKSKESQTTLLHFIVRTYIDRKRNLGGVQILEIPLPIPEPSDVERANQVDFDEVKRQISELNRQLKSTKNITEKVISNSTPQNLEPFKSKMEEFIEEATKSVDKLYKKLDDCRDVFIETMKFYHYAPKTGTLETCTPKNFFEHWTNFTNDFKDIMKKEIEKRWNELLKQAKDLKLRRPVKTTKMKSGCLKERIMRLSKK